MFFFSIFVYIVGLGVCVCYMCVYAWYVERVLMLMAAGGVVDGKFQLVFTTLTLTSINLSSYVTMIISTLYSIVTTISSFPT